MPIISNIDDPIGSIKQSFLTEAQFQAENGLGWVLCDGRNVSGSKYESITGDTTIPDARGRYLRAKDHGAGVNPDGDIPLRALQADQNKEHTHAIGYRVVNAVGGAFERLFAWAHINGHTSSEVLNSGGNETRPRSITCNTFIKIN